MTKDEIEQTVNEFAKANKAKVEHTEHGFMLHAKAWGVEILPAHGYIYVHGLGELNGVSTNIEDASELAAALERLKGAK